MMYPNIARFGPVTPSLVASEEPAIQRRILRLMGRVESIGLSEHIRTCTRVQTLLGMFQTDAALRSAGNAYNKWLGAHWVLVDLAEMGYPPGDQNLYPLRDQVLDTWLAPAYRKTFVCEASSQAYRRKEVPVVAGRARRCASQQGNALFAMLRLGIADERAHELVRLLLTWQWPDGGWNCDKNQQADTSSFHETITPLRGLAAYLHWEQADASLRSQAYVAAGRAAEVFLTRRLFRRLRDGEVIHPSFLQLAYPRYWHYDLLFGLIVMKEVGLLADARCSEALAILEGLRHPDGGWAAERKHYRVVETQASKGGTGWARVDWGAHGKGRSNPWVTLDALEVLAAASRL